MRRLFIKIKFCIVPLACLMLIATHTRADENIKRGDMKIASSQDFDIGATDQKSLRTALSLTNIASEICRKYFPDFPAAFPQKITLLLDTEKIPQEQSYEITKEGGGFINLRLFWNESLDLETTCLAIMDALLQRYLYYQNGTTDTSYRRAWPVEALSVEFYLKLRPAKIEHYRRIITSKSTPLVDEFLINQTTQVSNMPAACLFLKTLTNENFNRRQIAFILSRALYGRSVKDGLLKYIPALDFNKTEPLENWWQSAQRSFANKKSQSLRSIDATREWLDAIIDFSTIKNKKGDSMKIKNLRDLWDMRSNPAVLDSVTRRRDSLIAGLLYINPVYHNNAQSLGLIFEAIIDNQREYIFTKHLINYLNDRDVASNLQRLTQRTLANP